MLEAVYYSIVILTSVFFFGRFGLNKLSLLVFIIFWEGLFNYLGNLIPGLWEFFKIFFFLYVLFYMLNHLKSKYLISERYFNLLYLLFSLSFLITHLFNPGSVLTILSQFLFKYSAFFLFLYIIKELFQSEHKLSYVLSLLISAIFIQIFLSFVKIIIYGLKSESIVGSVQYIGGGAAVVLTFVFLIFFSIIQIEKRFRLKKYIYLLPIIVFIASLKRAPVFLYPVFYFFLVIFPYKKLSLNNIVKYVPVVLLLFYFGVRTNATLNPENSNWGSFNLKYVTDYMFEYNFGTSKVYEINETDITSGRGGSLFLLFQPGKIGLRNAKEILFGRGIVDYALSPEGRFVGGKAYGIEHYGLLSSAVIVIYSLGLSGFIIMVLMSLYIIFLIRTKRLLWIILILYMFELFFYGNQLFINHASAFIIIFCIYYSNYFKLRDPILSLKKYSTYE